jgi:hypothetical protein
MPANRWPGANRAFEFNESGQLFIRTHNEAVDRRDARLQSRSFARWNRSGKKPERN